MFSCYPRTTLNNNDVENEAKCKTLLVKMSFFFNISRSVGRVGENPGNEVANKVGKNNVNMKNVSVWFQSKERQRNGIFGFGRARNETSTKK